MYSERFIEHVKDSTDLVSLIGKYTELRRAGSNMVGLSCFAQEKTPSLNVSPDKQLWKDYSSGFGGDAIAFVMEKEGLSFLDAIEWLARENNIPLEQKTEEDVKRQETRKTVIQLVAEAHKKYLEQWEKLSDDHWAKQDLINRGFDLDVAKRWKIGFAPSWRFLCDQWVTKGLIDPATRAGLVVQKADRNHDFFAERYLFPVCNTVGQVVTFGGRSQESKPKYLNGPETAAYNKQQVLFGLNLAATAIRKTGTAYLVEGYWDVVAMHEDGLENTVASCGTGFNQAPVLKRYARKVVIIYDGDSAGIRASKKAIKELIKEGIKAEVCFLPEGLDPCDLRKVIHHDKPRHEDLFGKETGSIQEYIDDHLEDGFIWLSKQIMGEAGEDPFLQGDAVQAIADILYEYENPQVRENYISLIRKEFKGLKADVFRKRFKDLDSQSQFEEYEDDDLHVPEGVNKDDVLKFGFYDLVNKHHTGYWFMKNKSADQLTNFVVKPLFHIYSKEDNKRMVEISNGFDTRVLELPSKSFISLDQFTAAMFDEGFFITKAGFTKVHLQKILTKIGRQFPLCYELRTLGWQEEGFFAFSNYIYNGHLTKYDEKGIATHDKTNYFSPAASSIQALERQENDAYENDRYLEYTETTIGFSDWSKQMMKVYGKKAQLAIAFSIVTLFRDLFFKLEGNCPHLYCYGQAQSGKSVFAMSLSNLFFRGLPAFNLNQGTDFAFFNRLERFRNCPVVFNEFDENMIKEEWFRAIKSIYDGEGRERGRNKSKAEVQKVKSTLVLLGQYLSSKDDGAVLMRCIPVLFEQQNERSQQQIEAFHKLKDMEEAGLSGLLIQLLSHRDDLKRSLPETYARIKREMREAIRKEGKKYKDRIVNNFCYLLGAVSEFRNRLDLGFSYEEFFNYCKQEIINLSDVINNSNALASFWRVFGILIDSNLIDGLDYKIETHTSVRVRVDGEIDEIQFEQPKRLLFFRQESVHHRYAKVCNQELRVSPLDMQTLSIYLKSEDAFIGSNPGGRFKSESGKSKVTTSWVMDYDMMEQAGINLLNEKVDPRRMITVSGTVPNPPEVIEKNGQKQVKFRVMVSESYIPGPNEDPISRQISYNCFDTNQDRFDHYKETSWLVVTGLLEERTYNDAKGNETMHRELEVVSLPNNKLGKEEDDVF